MKPSYWFLLLGTLALCAPAAMAQPGRGKGHQKHAWKGGKGKGPKGKGPKAGKVKGPKGPDRADDDDDDDGAGRGRPPHAGRKGPPPHARGKRPAHAGQPGRPDHAGRKGPPPHARGKRPAHAGQAGGPGKRAERPGKGMRGDQRDKARRGNGKRGKSAMVGVDKIGKERRKHMRRLAKIDRLDAIAQQTGNETLKTKAAMIREKEMARHARVMERLGAAVEPAPAPVEPDAPNTAAPATAAPGTASPRSKGPAQLPNPNAPATKPDLKPMETKK